jgi:hypothetical protein
VIEAVAFSMLVEGVAWNLKECCVAGKAQTAACACLTQHGMVLAKGELDGAECVASLSSSAGDCHCLL